ncbi:uncharacterized protein CANTADRAFT_3841 [Suhomyces tanzawaensis NRRL Y-17324]|uniref:Uncharacterized protein n=1 Tax=Suhomyces tanzawaensis NRRL Y-17324 TaxID=984487 RepID=A0A1E4SQJ7_9ASCO|nr:uncharacterized protein CANTADRAFT_3841 [Suhomyces tanzawaensis NRRL Y-17324]ODV81768.1 hypothetical protein CANTADRAFT_3841 [Suhomyces tanzawaensis NRRL Y-17324]
MKVSILATTVLSASIVSAAATPKIVATPSSEEYHVDLAERGIVDSLISGVVAEIPTIIGSIDFEGIAGFANRLLTEDDNVKYLDNVLVGLKNTNLLPQAAVFIVSHDYTRQIAGTVLNEGLAIAGKVNSTNLFVALDKSGLAYGLVASTLEDPNLFPFTLNVVKKLIASGAINFGSILDAAKGILFSKRDILEMAPKNDFAAKFEKRDNIEDLLTTVFSSVERSKLVEETVSQLLADPQFEDAAAVILEGVFSNLSATISGLDFAALQPLLTSLIQSGLLEDVISQALHDQQLLSAVISNIGHLLAGGQISARDLVSDEVAASYGIYTRDVANTTNATTPVVLENGAASFGASTLLGASAFAAALLI